MTDSIDDKKVEKALKKLHRIFNRHKLSVPEIVVAYGNLGYHLGAAMAGFSDGKGPDYNTLQREYFSDPTVDVGLMIQGLMITAWEETIQKKPKLSNLAERYKKQKENEEDK